MHQTNNKNALSTGEVARICNVAPQTVSKWIDSGALEGYRIPGSKFRRIPVKQLVRFMKAHGMPLNGLMTGNTRVLIVDEEKEVADVLHKILEDEGKFEVEVASGGFAAGITAERFRPHVILLDMHLSEIDGAKLAEHVKSSPELSLTKIIAMSETMSAEDGKELLAGGFEGFLRKPFQVQQVVEAIEEVTAVVY